MNVCNIRFTLLTLGILTYAILSNPTPNIIGAAEISIGILLFIAIGIKTMWAACHVRPDAPQWEQSAKILLLYGLSIPLIGGLLNGNAPSLMLRDVIPFLFVVLPLFLLPLLEHNDKYRLYFLRLTVLVGLIFAWRVFEPLINWSIIPGLSNRNAADPNFLANSPTVLFAGFFLIALALQQLYQAARLSNIMRGILFALIAALPLATFALIMQRASIAYVGVIVAAFLIGGFIRAPRKTILPLLLVASIAALCAPFIAEIANAALHKTTLVGLNMRYQETLAVINELQSSPLSILCGKGWGATFASPAVGGVTVNFTHSLITTYWLKTGLFGVILVMAYLWMLAKMLIPVLYKNSALALAIIGVLIINIFFYASFKSIDFGLVLTLIPLFQTHTLKKEQIYGNHT